jgi:hypothetical protein
MDQVVAARFRVQSAADVVARLEDRRRGFTTTAGPNQVPPTRAVTYAGEAPLRQPLFDEDMNDEWRKRKQVRCFVGVDAGVSLTCRCRPLHSRDVVAGVLVCTVVRPRVVL